MKILIPQIKLFDYYYSYYPDPRNLVQVIGEANHVEATNHSPKQIALIQKRSYLCTLLNEIGFTINSYGIINFFAEYPRKMPLLGTISDLLVDYGDTSAIEFVKEANHFYGNIKYDLEKYKNTTLSLSERQLIHETLRKKAADNFSCPFYQNSIDLGEYIIQHPEEFCIDENGNIPSTNFSGTLQLFYKSKILIKEYPFINNKIEGIAKDFYAQNGKPSQFGIYRNGKKIKDQKRWNTNGILVYDNNDEHEKWWDNTGNLEVVKDHFTKKAIGYHKNGQVKSIKEKDGTIIRWDENGNKLN